MKIVITGSLGYVGSPLAQLLIKQGHTITIVSSSADRRADIETLGATAAIGTMADGDFLAATFKGADAIYCMISPAGGFNDPNFGVKEIIASADKIADSYFHAIIASGVKRVVYLSSVGAHMPEDNGLLIVHHNAENTLGQLPGEVSISFMRPVGFYKNLFAFIQGIKTRHVIASNYGGDDNSFLVSPVDIANAVAEELTDKHPASRKIRYIASEELTCKQVAAILGEAIGQPDLQWITITDEQLLQGMKAFGMNESIAECFVEMNRSSHNGKIYEDYLRNKPVLGKTKLAEFAKEFAAAYAG